jgi:predicted Zn-dependent peptidase
MAIDRTLAPALQQIEKIELIQPQKYELHNGIPVYVVNAGTQELVKIEFIFKAGSWHENKPLLSDVANALLNSGTNRFSSEQLADHIDYYGAFLELEADYEHGSVSIFSLNKHLNQVLPYIEELIKDAVFPDNELKVHLQNSKQRLQVSEEKISDVCRKRFKELLYGSRHPYGLYPKPEDYNHLTRNDLISFYNQFYHSTNCIIIVSGKISENVIDLIDMHFGRNDWGKTLERNEVHYKEELEIVSKELIFKENALQSAIRIGKKLFNKTHPDYHAMQVLNTISGGYYGSRLMKNVREDKGYTYGISSAIASFQHSGYFFISTEVGVEVCEAAINEIYSEIEKLKNQIIPDAELQLVKNYLTGMFLKSIDGPFALADRFKGILFFDLDYEYYNNYLRTIQTVSAEQLQELAKQYLNDFTELVVGNK